MGEIGAEVRADVEVREVQVEDKPGFRERNANRPGLPQQLEVGSGLVFGLGLG